MSCMYFYNGFKFDSEVELDDFLYDKLIYMSKYGDLVFEKSPGALKTKSILEEESELVKTLRASREKVYNEDGTSYKYNYPYVGVNQYVAKFKDENGDRLVPEFIPEEYWPRRFESWKLPGGLTDDELQVLFDNDADIKAAQLNGITDETYRDGTTKFENYRKLIEEKWEWQCLNGDAIHSVFQLYFSKGSDIFGEAFVVSSGFDKDIVVKDMLGDPNVMSEFRKHLSALSYNRKEGKGKVNFDSLLNELQVKQTIQRCQELAKTIENKFGKDVDFYPEFEISGKVNVPFTDEKHNNIDKVIGIIDLLVVDKDGIPHIFDYKTSTKAYNEYYSAKKLAFQYQVAMYGRLLAQKGLNIDEGDLYNIVPILMTEFKKGADGKYKFRNVQFPKYIIRSQDQDIRTRSFFTENLDQIIDIPEREVDCTEVLKTTLNVESEWFKDYNQFKTYTDEEIRDELKKDGALDGPDPETNKWIWKPSGSITKDFVADSDVQLIEKVKKYRNGLPQHRKNVTTQVINALTEGINSETAEVNFAKTKMPGDVNANPDWFRTHMKQYCNSNWKVCKGTEYEALKALGIIVLKNIHTGQRDVIKISMSNFYRDVSFGANRMNIAGCFKPDIYYASQQNNLMLPSKQGNIELMEAMIAINQMKSIFGDQGILGEVKLMDPIHGIGMSASNAELKYCFDELCKECPVEGFTNNFKNGNILMATKAHIARTIINDVMEMAEENDFGDVYARFKDFADCKSSLDAAIDDTVEKKIEALEKVKKMLESTDDNHQLVNVAYELGELSKPHVRMYNQVLLAIAELKGYNFRQQLKDHDKYWESLMIPKNGLHGTYIDNPGNLQSETLNLITKMVTEAYLNVRQDIQNPAAKLRELTAKLKKEKNYGWLEDRTTGNDTSLFENMYDSTYKDDLVFKNPWKDGSLSEVERDYLKTALQIINKDRFPVDTSSAQFLNMINNNSYDYFKVPLARGDSSAFSSLQGLLGALKDKLRGLLPKEIMKRAKEKAEGLRDRLYDADSERRAESSENLYEMNNIFSNGINSKGQREEFIAKRGGKGYFESNLETLTLKHVFAYSMKRRVDAVMPTIKAATIHLSTLGFMHNTKYNNDIEYIEKYIKNKIKNESIIDPKYQMASEYAGKVKHAASLLTLAFSPVQLIGQTIQGIWNDISLIIRKPDGTNAFTLKNMLTAAKCVYHDLFKSSDSPTIPKLINELYGINDMDMNQYVDHIKSDKHGFHNLSNMLFKFASRPDFYNRMIVFTAKMINEGCYDAHHVDEHGNLVYNWKEDKRFNLYANGINKQSLEYRKQEALYHAMAKQFLLEHTTNPDGTEFKMGDPLPRAYTNLEAESMKSLSDTIYGYYSHEKKSMVQSTLIGGLWMQFKTFWSGKKNQYLAGGGVKLEGNWKQYEENGQKFYYQTDPDGTIRYDLPPTTEETVAPVMRWEGNWKEGILRTIWDLGSAIKENGFREGWDSMWNNEDENLRNAYRSNIKQLSFDITMFMVLGPLLAYWLSQLFSDASDGLNKDDPADGAKIAAMNVALKSLNYSVLDFNFLSSIGEPGTSWTPFSFLYYTNLAKRSWATAMNEDKSNWNILVNASGAAKQTKAFWDALIPDPDSQS